MLRRRLFLAGSVILLAGACSDSDDPAPPAIQTYSVSLTGLTVVKQGSDEELTIDGLPADGATLTND